MASAKYLVRFCNFWPNSSRAIQFFFVPFLSEISQSKIEVVQDNSKVVDLEMHSVYIKGQTRVSKILGRKLSKFQQASSNLNLSLENKKAKRRIWFSGENQRPPLHLQYDAYLSYDNASFGLNSFYLPLWVLNLDWFDKESAHGFIAQHDKQELLLKKRSLNYLRFKEREFCCIFANHLDNTRNGIISELTKLGKVDIFGYAGKKIVKDKKVIASNYRFIFCPENDLYPGYVSEKLLEAYQTTAVPLYWGLDTEQFFDPQSHLNLSSFGELSSFIRAVEYVNKQEEAFAKIVQSPLLSKAFDLSGLVHNLRKHI
jgi:hypothetical protein